ncbi:Endonuclease/exonuclease/phosphatase, partial [Dendryphion nanum]
MVSKSMFSGLLQKQLTYPLELQPFFSFSEGIWKPHSSQSSCSSANRPLESLHILSWNIDFSAPFPRARMTAALSHIEYLLTTIPSTSAVIVFLQEMQEVNIAMTDVEQQANDLTQLREAPWVQDRFYLTDIDSAAWDSLYGQVTLIDRRLNVAQVSRLRFVSEYQRDALFVDVPLTSGNGCILRLCNVHLDSTYGSMRPIQWKALAKHLQDQGSGITGSVLAGDCNANQPRDETEPQNNGFKDAYVEFGGREDDEEGLTWGFQSVDWKRWGRKRLDKIVFWGEVEAKSLARIGVGVKVQDDVVIRELEALDELTFATDHFGLIAELSIRPGLV